MGAGTINTLPRAFKASHDAGRDDGPTSCLPGTRETVFTSIAEWLDDIDGVPVFWLNGLAGTGKSAIAKSVAESASQRATTRVATFFCSNRDTTSSLSDPSLIIPTLAFQLACSHPRFKAALTAVLEKQPDLGHANMKDQFFRLFIDPLQVASDRHSTILIIDGLDECFPTGASATLLHLFIAHSQSWRVLPLRLLISCRPEHHLRRVFARFPDSHRQLVLHEVDEQAVSKDIRLYLLRALTSVPDELQISLPADWPRECDIAKLSRRAGKLFVHASLSIQFIAHDCLRDPQSQLDTLLGLRDLGGANPYLALESLYLQLLSNALPNDVASPDVLARFKLIIGTIIAAHDKLSIPVLSSLTRESPSAITGTLYHLHSVITTPDVTPQVFHPSFADFITGTRGCTERLFIRIQEQHTRLALRSLELLSGLCVGLTKPELTPEIQYACRHWTAHVHLCSADDTVLKAIETFSQQTLIYWLEAMCVLGHITSVRSMLSVVFSWISKLTPSEEVQLDVPIDEIPPIFMEPTTITLSLLRDAYCLVLTHLDDIHDAPERLYSFVLPSLPRSSALYRRFMQMERPLVLIHDLPD